MSRIRYKYRKPILRQQEFLVPEMATLSFGRLHESFYSPFHFCLCRSIFPYNHNER
jgi:hypothetical protein